MPRCSKHVDWKPPENSGLVVLIDYGFGCSVCRHLLVTEERNNKELKSIKEKRWQAALATLSGMMAVGHKSGSSPEDTAKHAFKIADAMLKAGGYDATQD